MVPPLTHPTHTPVLYPCLNGERTNCQYLAWCGFCHAVAYRQAEKGTDAEEQNKEGVSLDKIASKRKLEKSQSTADVKQDEDDDI